MSSSNSSDPKYTTTGRGGNAWDHRVQSDGSHGYHYSNQDGSYYYKNGDGSTYYKTSDGYSQYTSRDGQVTKKHK
ncbi:hypothetical protein CERSUDRAFT_90904 [Gelatoporia subvermispora B]|uniref:Uncharacterized protein n=1 Tax=Ceriporiopsis subvermispora (strain B) TaxID=914234 RepID=M2RUZ5_CERS8|nr:hypothetical protein CERSUDRAFT_90904 [Gelatoporia subvermispora B]